MVLDIVGKREVPGFLEKMLKDESVYGKFNESPANWCEISEDDLVKHTAFSSYTPVAMDYKQVIAPVGEYDKPQYRTSGRQSL